MSFCLNPASVNVAIAWASRGATILAQLYCAHLVGHRFGVATFASFSVVLGLQAWFMLMDFGWGPALQNLAAREPVASRFSVGPVVQGLAFARRAALPLALVVAVLLVALIGGGLRPELRPFSAAGYGLVALTGFLMALSGPVNWVSTRLLYGSGLPFVPNVVATVAAFGSAGALLLVPASASFWTLMAAYYASPAVLALGVGVWLWRKVPRAVRPERPDAATVREIRQSARGFALFSLITAAVLQADYVILARMVEAEGVALYGVYARVFGLIFFIYNSWLMIVQPSFTRLVHEGRGAEVLAVVRRGIAAGVAFTVVATAAVFVLRHPILGLIVGDPLPRGSESVIALFGCYFVLRVWSDTWGAVILGCNGVNALLKWGVLQGVIGLLAQLYGGYRWGAPGVIAGQIVASLLTAAWVLPRLAGPLVGGKATGSIKAEG